MSLRSIRRWLAVRWCMLSCRHGKIVWLDGPYCGNCWAPIALDDKDHA